MNPRTPMTTLPFDRDRVLSLTADYADGTCMQADAEQLESLLRADPAARRVFIDYCMLLGQLSLSTVAVGPGGREDGAVRVAGTGGFGMAMGRVASVLVGLSLAAAVLAMIVTLPRAMQIAAGAGAYDSRQLPVVTVASLRDCEAVGRTLTPSTVRSEQATRLVSVSGADVKLSEASVFGVTATDAGSLYDGSVKARLTTPDANYSVTTSNLRIVDKGTAFSVERIDADHVHVTVLDGEVEVQSRVRLPVSYWPFDDDDSAAGRTRTTDIVGGLAAILGSGATPVAGIVGAGAVRFDNTPAAVAKIEGGTGDRVGTGRLSMTEGITIEAMIVSAWSGRFRDYDEIYRKEDGNSRVLLSFQHDGLIHRDYSEPDVPAGPCLSFGLHLAGRGYQELDMPLDGLNGRPTLAEITDGTPHHVVATYDSFTGRKAIFIDGVKRFEHVYPVGTLVLSGGPVAATIGNHVNREPFHGVIDEVALYDFALTDGEITGHHARVQAGGNYFGSDAAVAGGARWQAVTRLVEGQSMTFNQSTGLPR